MYSRPFVIHLPFERRAVCLLLFLCFSFGFNTATFGATPAPQSSDEGIEEVVVTGTWLPNTLDDKALPVSRVTKEHLSEEGSISLQDLIRYMPFSQGADSESDQYGTRTGADRASINLRGLGPSRSLVLLNGRRLSYSPGAIPDQAQLFVDINLLPDAALERIEVLRDGAASTYGSDAIGGVLNFITRTHFQGVEFESRRKFIAGSDGDNDFRFLIGEELRNGQGFLLSSLGLTTRSKIPTTARSWMIRNYAENRRGGWSGTGRPAVFVPLSAFLETDMNATAMRAVGIADPNCERVGGAHTNYPESRPEGGICRFQYTPFVNLVQETTRYQWFSEFSWTFENGIFMSTELLIAGTHVPNWATSPSYPPSQLIDLERALQANNPGLVDMASKYPHLYGDFAWCEHPYCRWNGDGGRQDAQGVPAPFQNVGWINGRNYGQGGPIREYKRESKGTRLSSTFAHETNHLDWKGAFTWSTNDRTEEDGDMFHYRDVRALLGLGGKECEDLVPNEVNELGQLEFHWTTLRDHAGQGPCTYYIPFSNAIRPHARVNAPDNRAYEPRFDNSEIYEYLTVLQGLEGTASLLSIETVASGESTIAPLKGAIGFAFGAQLRREHYERRAYTHEQGVRGGALHDLALYPCRAGPSVFDCEEGRTGVFSYLPPGYDIDASRFVYALFGETFLPLARNLGAQLSIRFENYGDNGGRSFDPKLAMNWNLSSSALVRFSLGSAFRAPSLNQTQAGVVSTSRQFIGRIGTFKPILAIGNPDLKPEEALTSNLGLVLQSAVRNGVDDFFMSVDWWNFAFSNPLVLEPFDSVLNDACPIGETNCNNESSVFAQVDFGGRQTVTDISAINVNVTNGPAVETSGIDANIRYVMLRGSSEWVFELGGTRTLRWSIDKWQFGNSYNALDRLNYDNPIVRTIVKWKLHTQVGVSRENYGLRWVVRYIDKYNHDLASEPIIEADLRHDLVATARISDNLSADFAVFNAMNEDPPWVLRQLNYDPVTHNPLGRIVQLGIRWSR